MFVLGTTTTGTTTLGFPFANNKSVSKFTLAEENTVTGLYAYYSNAYSGVHSKAIIYSDNSGSPDALVAVSDEVTAISLGWNFFALPSRVTLAAGDYWLGIIADTQLNTSAESGATSRYSSDTYSDGPSDPFGSATTSSYLRPIYATTSPIGVSVDKVVACMVVDGPFHQGINVNKILACAIVAEGSEPESPGTYPPVICFLGL